MPEKGQKEAELGCMFAWPVRGFQEHQQALAASSHLWLATLAMLAKLELDSHVTVLLPEQPAVPTSNFWR